MAERSGKSSFFNQRKMKVSRGRRGNEETRTGKKKASERSGLPGEKGTLHLLFWGGRPLGAPRGKKTCKKGPLSLIDASLRRSISPSRGGGDPLTRKYCLEKTTRGGKLFWKRRAGAPGEDLTVRP